MRIARLDIFTLFLERLFRGGPGRSTQFKQIAPRGGGGGGGHMQALRWHPVMPTGDGVDLTVTSPWLFTLV